MKRVKFILMTITLAAVVGGSLAFKVSRMYGCEFCTTVPIDGTCGIVGGTRTTCSVYEQAVAFTNNFAADFICTTTANAGGHLANSLWTDTCIEYSWILKPKKYR